MALIDKLKQAARPLARVGCASIGTVYILVGVLAVLALSGVLTGSADEERMVHVVMDQPGGTLVVWAIVLGIVGYIVWRGIEVIADPYNLGNDWKGRLHRGAIGLSALGYGVIAWSAASIASGNEANGNDNGEDEQQLLVAQVLDWPAGDWLVGIAGLVVIAVACLQVVVLVRGGYKTEINLHDRSPGARRAIQALAWYGYSARGVILGVLGYFLLRSAMLKDPEQVGDTDTAFDFIGGGVVGDSAFLIVAVGTIAYGAFMYACARFYQYEQHEL